MLVRLSALRNWRVEANDGAVGPVVDVFFDDERWGARYVVVDAGQRLRSQRVLLSPASVRRPVASIGVLHVDLTVEQIANSPDVDTDKPVSRHYEIAHALHYGYPRYWAGPLLWGASAFPGVTPTLREPPVPPAERDEMEAAAAAEEAAAAASHLRSGRELIGYRVDAVDGDAGDLEDLVVDVEGWAIRHLLVDARRWWPGGQVLIEPHATREIRWSERSIRIALTRDEVRHAPAPG